jgi:hypothetical protein
MRSVPSWIVLLCLHAGAGSAFASETAVHLDLSATDIESVTLEQKAAHLKLTPAAALTLKRITESNVGRVLSMTVEGIPAVRATVMGTIDSGQVSIDSPSDALRKRLAEIQEARSRGQDHRTKK